MRTVRASLQPCRKASTSGVLTPKNATQRECLGGRSFCPEFRRIRSGAQPAFVPEILASKGAKESAYSGGRSFSSDIQLAPTSGVLTPEASILAGARSMDQ